jgi:hypothetical protein
VFQNNDKLVAHDSEGFEAGKVEEVAVVKNFIEKRNKEEDVYQRLHMVWFVDNRYLSLNKSLSSAIFP